MKNRLLTFSLLLIICDSRRIEAFAPPGATTFFRSSASKYNIEQRVSDPKHGKLSVLASTKTESENQQPHQQGQQDSTVLSLMTPSGNQEITLIGTAHLSEKSNEQVKRLIAEIKPNVVMIELDPSRLGRIGISDVKEISLDVVYTGEEIDLPSKNKDNIKNGNWFLTPLKDTILEVVSRTARVLLTGMYKDMSKEMKNDQGGGGEFLVAIRAAEDCNETKRLVLGDRSSVTTIRRAAALAWESGNPLGVLNRLNECNAKEMKQLEEQVQERYPNIEDRGELQVAVMEALKEDDSFRDRLFRKLEQEVPEFTEAFLKERDYIMGESIRQELDNNNVERIVGVVGLAHLPGMAKHLKQTLKLE